MVQNYHILIIKFHGATNTRGARVSIYSPRFEERKFIDYDYGEYNIIVMAQNYLEKRGFDIIGKGELKNEYVLISTTFKPLKK